MTDEELKQLDNDELFWKIAVEAKKSIEGNTKPLLQCYQEYIRRFCEEQK